MNIAGNFNNGTGLRLPDETKTTDSLGIHWEGPVMSGKKSAEKSRKDDATQAVFEGPQENRTKAYSSVKDYDTVVRSHCRLDTEQPASIRRG